MRTMKRRRAKGRGDAEKGREKFRSPYSALSTRLPLWSFDVYFIVDRGEPHRSLTPRRMKHQPAHEIIFFCDASLYFAGFLPVAYRKLIHHRIKTIDQFMSYHPSGYRRRS